jgi:hypothetical protein
MTEQRLKSVQRLLSLQKQMHKLAEWRLLSLQRQEADLAARQKDLLGYLDKESVFTGLFAKSLFARLKSIDESRAELALRTRDQEKEVLEECRRLGRFERGADNLAQKVLQARADVELAETVERSARGDDTSLP